MSDVESSARNAQVTVIGDAEASDAVAKIAEQVGATIARQGWTLVTGGRGGVMQAASRGAQQEGGMTVSVIPSDKLDGANSYSTVVIPTGMGHARNALTVLAADAVIAVGGGAGTLSEMCLAWIHGRPIITVAGTGGWAERISGEPLDQRNGILIECSSTQEVEQALLELLR